MSPPPVLNRPLPLPAAGRSLRIQTAEAREQMLEHVQLPVGPQTGCFTTKASAARLPGALGRQAGSESGGGSGTRRSDVQAILAQIRQFSG
jgi:hypothetical protein